MVASLRPSWTSNTSPLPGSNPAYSIVLEMKPMQVCCSLAREYGEVRLQYDNPL